MLARCHLRRARSINRGATSQKMRKVQSSFCRMSGAPVECPLNVCQPSRSVEITPMCRASYDACKQCAGGQTHLSPSMGPHTVDGGILRRLGNFLRGRTDIADEVGMLLIRISQAIASSMSYPPPKVQPRFNAHRLRMRATHYMPEYCEFQGDRKELRKKQWVTQVNMLSTPWLHSQRRHHTDRRVRHYIAPLRGFSKESRDLLGQLGNAMRHFTEDRERGETQGKSPLLARNK